MEENVDTTPEEASKNEAPEAINEAVEPTPEASEIPEETSSPEAENDAADPANAPAPEEITRTDAEPNVTPAETVLPKDQTVAEAEVFVKTIGTHTSFELMRAKEVILSLLAVIKSN